MFERYKHASLFRPSVNYSRKRFCRRGCCCYSKHDNSKNGLDQKTSLLLLRVRTTKLFTIVILMVLNSKLERLPLPYSYTCRQCCGVIIGLHSKGRSQALPTIFRLGWKCMRSSNALAYYVSVLIKTQKVLYYWPPEAFPISIFT
jgi:hypothetical protein